MRPAVQSEDSTMKAYLLRGFRVKSADSVTAETSLNRCLNIVDLVVIGIGGMVGSGIYVMTGITAKEQAGPGIVVSFVLASVVILLIAACFTELSARLHKTGSTYLYLYLAVGEFPAVIMGVSILVSSLLGGATNARAWSSYANFLFNESISTFTEEYIAQWDYGSPISRYPDLVAVAVVIILTLVVALGVKCSARFSAVFVVINIFVLCVVIVIGFIYGKFDNWTSLGNGGFLPYGWQGILSGAASCFWAFSGFEMISCAVEESCNPRRNIPLAMLLTMLIVTSLYVGSAASLTLMVPSQLIDSGAPLPAAFVYAGLHWQRYIVVIGPLCGFTTTFISNTFGFVRISLAMAEDGLLYSWFAKVNTCSQVPVSPVLLCGLLQAFIACFCDIRDLISFNVNILLLSYASACIAVIILRYSHSSTVKCHLQSNDNDDAGDLLPLSDSIVESSEMHKDMSVESTVLISQCACFEPLLAHHKRGCITVSLAFLLVSMLGLSCALYYGFVPLAAGKWWSIVIVSVTVIGTLVFMVAIGVHQQHLDGATTLKLPCVPLTPSVAVFACLILLVSNSTLAGWIGCLVLLLLAGALYGSYGIHHSCLNSAKHFHNNQTQLGDDLTMSLLADEDDANDNDVDEETISSTSGL